MILAHLDQADRYAGLNPLFPAALAWLRACDPAALGLGRHDLGDGLAAIVSDAPGRGRQKSRLEVHRRTVDIQFCLSGDDVIGWRAAGELRRDASDYDEQADASLFYDEPTAWCDLPRGHLAILFPEDGHAPLAAPEGTPLLKVVIKVPVR